MKDYSPEERLLRLIKGKHKNPPVIASPEGARQSQEKEAPKSELPAPKEEVGPVKSLPNKPHLYILAGIAFLIILAVFVFNSFFGEEARELSDMRSLITSLAQETEALDSKEPVKKELPKEAIEPRASFSEYQKLLKEKSIFVPSSGAKGSSAILAGDNTRDIIKDLKLVGVIPGAEPQAIIEDKSTQQTLFLKKGEHIRNIEIQDISNGKVILSYGNEKITLSL